MLAVRPAGRLRILSFQDGPLRARRLSGAAAADALRAAEPPWILSPFVLAELDYLVATRVGIEAERGLLAEVGRGVYRLESFDADDVAAAEQIIGRSADLEIGLADASLVVLATRYGVSDLLTLDERHFRVLRGPGGRPFRILPADEVGVVARGSSRSCLHPRL